MFKNHGNRTKRRTTIIYPGLLNRLQSIVIDNLAFTDRPRQRNPSLLCYVRKIMRDKNRVTVLDVTLLRLQNDEPAKLYGRT